MRPIRVALHIKDLGFIDEPVNDGMGNGVVSKNLVELSERQVSGSYGPQLCIVPA